MSRDHLRDRLDALDGGTATPLAEMTPGALYMTALKHANGEAEHPNASEAFAEYDRRMAALERDDE